VTWPILQQESPEIRRNDTGFAIFGENPDRQLP
jgi:hypothetical protein